MSVLAPGLLIAAPPMGDPNFDRTVILLASHDEEGAFGWVLNGETLLSLGELLDQADIECSGDLNEGTEVKLVSRGGPVSPGQVWLVYPSVHEIPGVEPQLQVAPGISATSSREFLQKLADGNSVPELRAFAGYAGWAPGQLEEEIRQGAWLPGGVLSDLIFRTEGDVLWHRAYESQGMTPLAFTTRTVGSA